MAEQKQMSNEDWLQRWADGKTAWHKTSVHFQLEKFFQSHLAPLRCVDKPLHVLVPLCGKSVDMVWLAKQNCRVTGIEYVTTGVETFMHEQNLEYTVHVLNDDAELYQVKSLPISIVRADIYALACQDLLQGEQVDAIWDCGGFVAINVEDRNRYANLMLSALRNGGAALVSALDFDKSIWPGPPHATTGDDMKSAWEANDDATVTLLESVPTRDEVAP